MPQSQPIERREEPVQRAVQRQDRWQIVRRFQMCRLCRFDQQQAREFGAMEFAREFDLIRGGCSQRHDGRGARLGGDEAAHVCDAVDDRDPDDPVSRQRMLTGIRAVPIDIENEDGPYQGPMLVEHGGVDTNSAWCRPGCERLEGRHGIHIGRGEAVLSFN